MTFANVSPREMSNASSGIATRTDPYFFSESKQSFLASSFSIAKCTNDTIGIEAMNGIAPRRSSSVCSCSTSSAHDVIEDFVTSALVFSSLSSSVFSFSIK